MANNIVAYIGYNSFDIILYLSRVLQKAGRRVLIVDYSEAEALTYSIPQIDGIDTNKDIMTYRRVDFTRMIIIEETAKIYDDILIDFGFSRPIINLSLITKVVYVSNMFRYNLNRLCNIKYYDELQISKELLIREATDLKIPIESMTEIIDKQITMQGISLLYLDEKDYENSLVCHYNQTFCFTRISGMLRGYLLKTASDLCGNVSDKQILTAYAKARKGE